MAYLKIAVVLAVVGGPAAAQEPSQMLWTAAPFEGPIPDFAGVHPDNKKNIAAKVASGEMGVYKATLAPEDLPESFDAAEKWPECADIINDIRDQSATDCCWAFSAAEVASDRLCIATKGKVKIPLSAKEMCFCPTAYGAAKGCNGGQTWAAWDYIQYSGLSTGNGYSTYPGPFANESLCSNFPLPACHHYGPRKDHADTFPKSGSDHCPTCDQTPACPTACDASAKAPYNDFANYRYKFSGSYNNIDAKAIQEQIYLYGPVQGAYTVAQDFVNYTHGIYHPVWGKPLGGHAIKFVGWGVENGTKYWKVANSWNKYWGESGFFRIVRGVDACGIEDEAIAPDGDIVWSGPNVPSV